MTAHLSRPRARFLLASAIALLPLPAFAATRTWIGSGINKSGPWATTSNWLNGIIPAAGDDALLSVNTATDATITYNYTASLITLNSVWLDNTSTGLTPANTILNMSANYLGVGALYVGHDSRASLNQSGGTVSLAGAGTGLFVGYNGSTHGTYTLSGSGYLQGSNTENIGFFGNGTFNQSGGFHESDFNTILGAAASATGTYNLSSGTLNFSSSLTIGNNGTGVFNQTGGLASGTGNINFLVLGLNAGASGTYNLSAGTLVITPSFFGSTIVGNNGTGALNLSGTGYASINSAAFYLGYNAGSSASLTIADNAILLDFGLTVGVSGTASVTQTGGTHLSSATIVINPTGSYTLSGGSLSFSSGDLSINGPFSQSGGSTSLASWLQISHGATLTLSGTAAFSAYEEHIGEGPGAATFAQSGGSHIVNAGVHMILANHSASSATYLLSGGDLNVAGNEYVGYLGNATFNQSGGTNVISGPGLFLGNSTSGNGTYLLSNGSLFLNNCSLSVGPNGTGNFLQSGGSLLITGNGQLSLGNAPGGNGTFTLNAGSLTLPTLTANTTGHFFLNGGVLTLSALKLAGGTASLNNNAATQINALTFSGTSPLTGQLNLNNSSLILQATSANKTANLAALASEILFGKGAGNWLGQGITSSTVAANPAKLTVGLYDNADLALSTFGGQSTDANSLLLTPALIGDANLDTHVDLADYDIWYKNVGGSANRTSHGDFNLDNQIDLADYDAWFTHVGAALPLAAQSASLSPSSVPEPASLALLVLAIPLLNRRRR